MSETELRFNWNAGMAVDPFDANGIYYGSQFLDRAPSLDSAAHEGNRRRDRRDVEVQYPLQSLQSSWDAPTPAQLAYLTFAESHLRGVIADYDQFYAEDVARFREAIQNQNISLFQ